VAAAFLLAARPAPALGDSITPNSAASTATYRLTADADIPVPADDATGPQVIARVVPPGTVVPPKMVDGTEASPLTILKSSTGFDPEKLIVALKDNLTNLTPGESPEQLFGLSFFGAGFKKGGQLDFSLSINDGVSTPPSLESLTPGVSIKALQTVKPPEQTPVPVTNAAPTGAQVPEPMSVLLWSVLTGAGVLRARGYRRARVA
jgi:hypothetical protein